MTAPLPMTGAPWTPEPDAIVFLPDTANVGFTTDEAYAFLSGGTEAVTALRDTLTAAAGDPHTSAMIAFIPSGEDVVELLVEDGEPIDQLHTTAYFLGIADEINDETRAALIAAVEEVVRNQPVIIGNVFAFSVFNPEGPEPCLVASVGGVDLEDAWASLGEAIEDVGFELPPQHLPWVPHITLAYDEDPRRLLTDELMEKTGPITYDRVRIAFAGVNTDIPLSSGYNETGPDMEE